MIPIIFEICENLIEFTLRFGEFMNNNPEYENYLDKKCGFPIFSALLPRRKIVREKLTTFCIKFNPFNFVELRRGQIQRFASAFPELKILKLSMFFIDSDDETYESTNNFYEPYFPTFSVWIKLLATKLKAIESFDVQFIPSFYRTRRLTPTDLSVFREYGLNK